MIIRDRYSCNADQRFPRVSASLLNGCARSLLKTDLVHADDDNVQDLIVGSTGVYYNSRQFSFWRMIDSLCMSRYLYSTVA